MSCENTYLSAATAGDSITNAYWVQYRDVVSPPIWEVNKVALGGLKAQQFNGDIPDKNGDLHDYTQDVIDIDPDNVLLMLGTNDSFYEYTDSNHLHFDTYTNTMLTILDRLDTAGVDVVLGLPTPLVPISERFVVAEGRLDTLYRPWLEAEAEARGYAVADFNTMFTDIEGWEEYFPDGVHPYTEEGELLMAELAVDTQCLYYIPEPPSLIGFIVGAIAIVAYAKLRGLFHRRNI